MAATARGHSRCGQLPPHLRPVEGGREEGFNELIMSYYHGQGRGSAWNREGVKGKVGIANRHERLVDWGYPAKVLVGRVSGAKVILDAEPDLVLVWRHEVSKSSCSRGEDVEAGAQCGDVGPSSAWLNLSI